jgi:aspartyl-tRNA(Asn)/glutamyl-tRNA(Gln) amidotransferase subunit A
VKNLNDNVKNKKIAYIKEINEAIKDQPIADSLEKVKNILIDQGAIVEEISFDSKLLEAIYPVYMIISCAEATSNNANLDGIKFGPRAGNEASYQEVMMKARTAGFGELIRRRFVIGSYSLFKDNQEELFLRAQKIRHLIVNKVNEILAHYDAIITPCSGVIRNPIVSNGDKASRLDKKTNIVENHLGLGNFAGLPSLTIPCGIDKDFPYGLNIMCKAFDEQNCFDIALNLEEHLSLKNLYVKGGNK